VPNNYRNQWDITDEDPEVIGRNDDFPQVGTCSMIEALSAALTREIPLLKCSSFC